MKTGTKVTIIPNEKHSQHVKKFYGKILEIEDVVKTVDEGKLYKVKGIKNYAKDEDLRPIPNTRVFKFYCNDLFYVFAAQTEDLAAETFKETIGDEFTSCEEIPLIEWDKKNINIWEDNDHSKKPFKESILDELCGIEPQFIFTNDSELF